MDTQSLCKFLAFFVLLELAAARTVTHHETITKSNGDKIHRTWTTNESDEEELDHREPMRFRDVETFQSSSDATELLKEAAKQKGMDPEAVAELLKTKAPVVRTFVDPSNGHKHTTTYKLDPSGSGISSRTLVEIPTVRTINRIVTKITQPETNIGSDPGYLYSIGPYGTRHRVMSNLPTRAKSSADSPTDQVEWSAEPSGTIWTMAPWHLEPKQQNNSGTTDLDITVEQTPTSNGTHIWWQPSVSRRYFSTSDSSSVEPMTFHASNDRPPFQIKSREFELMEPRPISTMKTDDIITKTSPVEDDVNRKSAKFPDKNLNQLIADLYKTTTSTTTTTTTTTTKPTTIKTIKIEDLPVTEVLNNGQPIDEEYLKNLPTHLRPAEVNQYKPTKTFSIVNIPETPHPSTPLLYQHTFEYPKQTPANPTPISHASPTPPQHPQHFQHNAIADYLGKIGLTVDDILSSNRRTLTKTISDADGNILTATFMLSSVMDDKSTGANQQRIKPIK